MMTNLFLSCLAALSRRLLVLVILSGLALLAACKDKELPTGVAATVNGSPITVRQLEVAHDADVPSWSNARGPSVVELKKQYGIVLTGLILQELVMQELVREGADVSDAELLAAESEIRADYPGEEFERVLVEDYIDLEQWRAMLRRRIALGKFAERVLRPDISVSLAEVETYYRAHEGDFRLPARVRLFVVEGEDRAAVEKTRAMLVSGEGALDAATAVSAVTIRDVLLGRDRLPPQWLKDIAGLAPGKASPVRSGGGNSMTLILSESLPERLLPITEAYPLIESLLVEQKMDTAFDAWAVRALPAADIRVSKHLVITAEDNEKDVSVSSEQALKAKDR